MMDIDAVPVFVNAALPFAGFDPLGRFDHPPRGGEHQRHQRIRHGIGQNGRGMHQEHTARAERLHIEIVVTHGNRRGGF